MHNHNHSHHHGEASTHEEIRALLDYMVKHNMSHASELESLADRVGVLGKAEAQGLINSAIKKYALANDELLQALKMLDE